MAWSDLSDLANTACRGVFGQTATVGTQTITAIFGSESVTLQPPGHNQVISTQPILDYRTADLTSQPVAGTSVSVAGNAYTVRSVHPDNQGFTRLRLHRAP